MRRRIVKPLNLLGFGLIGLLLSTSHALATGGTMPHRVEKASTGTVADGIVGLALMQGSEESEGYPVVKDVQPGGSAEEEGHIKTGDRIIGVENDTGTRTDFKDKSLVEVVGLIRGSAGTKVKVVVQHAGQDEKKVYELVRKPIMIP